MRPVDRPVGDEQLGAYIRSVGRKKDLVADGDRRVRTACIEFTGGGAGQAKRAWDGAIADPEFRTVATPVIGQEDDIVA